jgi:predicted RNA methylase
VRLVAQAKLGFYPIPPAVVSLILRHLRMPAEGADQVYIIDPCAGEGKALKQFADGLGVPPKRTYAVELDGDRADAVRALLGEGANVLGPASFLGTRISSVCYSLVFCNPPFDFELGGGRRQEHTFARAATRLLVPGGILVLVMPKSAIYSNDDFRNFLDANYDQAALFRHPDEHRKYTEYVYIGRRRAKPKEIPYDKSHLRQMRWYEYRSDPAEGIVGEGGKTWTLPAGEAPWSFKKDQLTEQEMIAAVQVSPLLRRVFAPPPPEIKRRPPLPLHKGHVALLLAAGLLDGPVYPEGEEPHVVRGTARKKDYEASRTKSENEKTGQVKEVVVMSQMIELIVRAATVDGRILTFSNDEEKDAKGKPAKGKPAAAVQVEIEGGSDSFKRKVQGVLDEAGVNYQINVPVSVATVAD